MWNSKKKAVGSTSLLCAAALVLLPLGSASAQSKEGPRGPSPTKPTESRLMESAGDGVRGQGFPSDCVGQSLTYWESAGGGEANGEGFISCGSNYAYLFDSTSLWRYRWYGIETMDKDVSETSEDDWINSISQETCAGDGVYTYDSSAYHEVHSWAGTIYSAETLAQNRFGC